MVLEASPVTVALVAPLAGGVYLVPLLDLMNHVNSKAATPPVIGRSVVPGRDAFVLYTRSAHHKV